MLNLRNNPKLDKFWMNNQTIRLKFAVLEVEYYKTRHINPVLADVDMEFYHILPPVQGILGEMTRLESLAMRLKAAASDITATTTTTAILTLTPTADQRQPKSRNTTTTTSTIVTLTPTTDQPQPKIIQKKH